MHEALGEKGGGNHDATSVMKDEILALVNELQRRILDAVMGRQRHSASL